MSTHGNPQQHSMHPRRRPLPRAGVLLGAIAIWLGACTTATDPKPVATIQLLPSSDSVEVGNSATLFVVQLRDAAGKEITGRTVRWSSSNEAVATVSSSGEVQGVATGVAIITALSEGISASATVKVILPVASIVLTPDSIEVRLTTTGTIGIQLIGPSGQAITNRTVTWASANTSIATVSGSGVVTPISEGQTTVTATVGGKSATAKVVVKPEPVVSVRIIPLDPVLLVRLAQSRQLAAECLSASGQVLSGRTVNWFSNNPAVVSVNVSTGLVQGLVLGQAVISANCEGRTIAVTVQVTQVRVASVSVTPAQLDLFVGQQQQLTAIPRDSVGNTLALAGRQVSWLSSNPPVADVTNTGVVRGLSLGTSQVQVTVDGVASPAIPVTVK